MCGLRVAILSTIVLMELWIALINDQGKVMFKIQYDYCGRFRIVHEKSGKASEWTRYQSLATIKVDGRTYIAGSAYGLLSQDEKVFEITPQKTKTDKSMEWTDSSTGKVYHSYNGDCQCKECKSQKSLYQMGKCLQWK